MAVLPKIHEPDPGKRGKLRRLRYVQVLPTLCTLGNIICGFGALHLCMRSMWLAGGGSTPVEVIVRNSQLMERLMPSHIVMAAYLLFLAMVFDGLDGRLARWTRHTTDFGGQLDSLADVVSFGVAPAVIMLTLLTRQLQGDAPVLVAPLSQDLLGRIAWVAAAVYVACAALRLARFNVENEPVEQAHQTFRGLPSPGAAGALACLFILHDHAFFYSKLPQPGGPLSAVVVWTLPVFALIFGLLMVSRFHYVHVVNTYLRQRRSFADIVKLLFVVALLAAYPEITLAVLVVGYALSGPVLSLFRGTKSGEARVPTEEESSSGDAAQQAGG